MATPARTPTYQRRAKRLLPEPELSALEQSIAAAPQAHPVVPKNEKDDLTPADKRELHAIVKTLEGE